MLQFFLLYSITSSLWVLANAADSDYTITEPTTGTTVSINQASVVQWNTSESNTQKVSLYLETKNDSKNLFTIASDISNSGSISWSPPAGTSPGSDYVVALQPKDSQNIYYSSTFTISSSNSSSTYYPTDGEKITAGDTTIVTWKVESNVTRVSIYLMEGSDVSDLKNVSTVSNDIANSGSVGYIIPTSVSAGTDYKFAIIDSDDNSNVVYSSTFTIVNDSSSSSGSDNNEDGSNTSTTTSATSSTSASSTAKSSSSSSASTHNTVSSTFFVGISMACSVIVPLLLTTLLFSGSFY